MSVEWVYAPLKFRTDAKYSRDDFAYRCKLLMAEVDDDLVRELLAIYIGWTDGLSFREVIRFRRLADGSAIPYTKRGRLEIGPDGEPLDRWL